MRNNPAVLLPAILVFGLCACRAAQNSAAPSPSAPVPVPGHKPGQFSTGSNASPELQSETSTPETFRLTLRIISKPPPRTPSDPPVYYARVGICKLVGGVRIEKDYKVRVGDMIGKPEIIQLDGKPVVVDFSTRYEVVAIEPAQFESDRGGPPITIWILRYLDDKGKIQELMQEEGGRRP